MKAIHGAKAKNDKIDSQKIAALLRGGLLPQAYVYPAAMRSTRDLLRRRLHLVRKRGQLLAHIQNTRAQYQLPDRRSYAFLCGRLLRDQRQKRIGEVISPEPPANFNIERECAGALTVDSRVRVPPD